MNSYDFSTNKTYLQCVCKDVEQCQDPAVVLANIKQQTPAPCQITYPCQATGFPSASGNQTFVCSNPGSNLVANITQESNKCSCDTKVNKNKNSFEQVCQCCLPSEFVRKSLIAPVSCPKDSIKETCTCTNSSATNNTAISATTLKCNCQHPTSNVVYNELQYPSEGQCDCDNITLGTKQCKCCVPYEVQVQQLQPVCSADSSINNCQCQGNSTKQVCSCVNAKNNLTFANLTTVNPSSCYCNPTSQNLKTCNCCVSASQFQSLKPKCPAGKDSTDCKCDSVKSGHACNCTNKYFFNTTVSTSFPPSTCACYGSADNQTTGFNCQCCASMQEISPAPQCSANNQSFVSCKDCKYDSVKQTVVCNCNGAHYMTPATTTQIAGLTLNTSDCGCVSDGKNSTNCDCCVSQATWKSATPVCQSGDSTLEKCMCQNNSVITQEKSTVTIKKNVTTQVTCKKTGCSGELCSSEEMFSTCTWKNAYACYSPAVCEYQISTGECGFTNTTTLATCLKAPPAIPPNKVSTYQNATRNVTVTNVTKLVSQNVTIIQNVTKYVQQCNCSNNRFPSIAITNAPVSPSVCGCDANNTACQCCVSRDYVTGLYFNALSCTNLTGADCNCNFAKNASCSCTPRDNTVLTYKNLTIDTSKNCLCTNNSANTSQQCRCCVNDLATMIPKAPVCAVNTTTTQSCKCEESFTQSTGKMNLQCQCKHSVNVTQNVTTYNKTTNTSTTTQVSGVETRVTNALLTSQQCNCFPYMNGTKSFSACNCCVPNQFTCPSSFAD